MNNKPISSELIKMGLVHHQNGEFLLALDCYAKALEQDSDQLDPHNLSADAYHRLGNNLKALYHANQAIAANNHPIFLNTRGVIFIGMGKFDEAISDLKSAIKLDPRMYQAHNNLSIAYRASKQLKKAGEHAQLALNEAPEFVEALISLAAVKQDLGDLEGAASTLDIALQLDQNHLVAISNRIKIAYRTSNCEELISLAKRALNNGYSGLDVYFLYAYALISLSDIKGGANLLLKGFASDRPQDYAQLHEILVDDRLFKVLFDCCQYFVTAVGNYDAPIRMYNQCILYAPKVADTLWINLGTIYFQLHRIPDAIRCNEEALKCNPNHHWALSNLGVFYISNKDSKKAIKYLEHALSIDPNYPTALGWLLKEKGFICDWDGYEELVAKVGALKFTGNTTPLAPFVALSVFNDPAQLLYWAKLSAPEFLNSVTTPTLFEGDHGTSNNGDRKIRIGYFSFDFRNHPVAHLTARMFEVHDHNQFDIYIYSYGPDDGSSVRNRIKANVKEFVDCQDLSILEMAQRIAKDKIDILVDLTGNTLHSRSQVFALRPARIQAHWLGFVGTMGSEHYDYIIADDIVAPPEDEGFFTEKVLRLPSGMHITDDSRSIKKDLGLTKVGSGLPESAFIFGCFAQTFKIQPEIYSAWMEILTAVPNSVLWLASGPSGAIDNLKQYAQKLNVDPNRIIVAERCEMDEYLNRFSLMDLYLDTFPYTSGTVASDALFAGCPLLTLSGKTMVSKMAGSILNHAGLPELVAYNRAEYVSKAIKYAQDPTLLTSFRTHLVQKREDKKLFNTQSSVRELERLYTKVMVNT